MLVLSRKLGEKIYIGENICITVVDIDRGKIRLGIEAPRDVPISAYAVHRIVRDAYHRIGITHGRVHALRHTFVRHLLERGSSLKEVADVLRHRSLNTSLIYAKLDHRNLSGVALPRPGSVS